VALIAGSAPVWRGREVGTVAGPRPNAQQLRRVELTAEDVAHIKRILAKRQPVRWPTPLTRRLMKGPEERIYEEVRTGVQSLPDLDPRERKRLVQRVGITAVRRYQLACFDVRSTLAFTIAVVLVIALFSLHPLTRALDVQAGTMRFGLQETGQFLVSSAWLVLMSRPRVRTTITRWDQRRTTLTTLAFASTVISLVFAVETLAGLYVRVRRFEVWAVPSAAAGVAIFVGIIAATVFDDHGYSGVLEPLDPVFLQIFRIAVDLDGLRKRRRWMQKGIVAYFNAALERAARSAERALRGRAPLTDFSTRRESGLRGAQLAAVIRVHKVHLATALSPQQVTDVRRSMTAGLLAWAERDLEALIANAPPVTFGSRIRAVTRRVYPALLLATAAVALPMIPALASSANQIHITLGVSAALALIAGGVSAPGPISDVVSKFEK